MTSKKSKDDIFDSVQQKVTNGIPFSKWIFLEYLKQKESESLENKKKC